MHLIQDIYVRCTYLFVGEHMLARCDGFQPDWWFIGGRSKPGETTIDAAHRNIKRELGLDVSLRQLQPIAAYSFTWAMRQQAPQVHVISVTVLLSASRAWHMEMTFCPDNRTTGEWDCGYFHHSCTGIDGKSGRASAARRTRVRRREVVQCF